MARTGWSIVAGMALEQLGMMTMAFELAVDNSGMWTMSTVEFGQFAHLELALVLAKRARIADTVFVAVAVAVLVLADNIVDIVELDTVAELDTVVSSIR